MLMVFSSSALPSWCFLTHLPSSSFGFVVADLPSQVWATVNSWKNSPSKVFKALGSDSNTLTQQGSASSNPLLLCSIEKAKTDLSIAKKRRRNSLAPNIVLGLKLPIWVHVSFRPIASMGLDDTELAIAAYLYGLIARIDVFKSLMPGKPIVSLVLDLIGDIMKSELTRESGYWFLPPVFAAIFLDEVLEDRSFYDFETTSNPISSEFEFEEQEGLPTLEDGSTLIYLARCVEMTRVDDGNRMKIAVSLVSRNHNMIEYRMLHDQKKKYTPAIDIWITGCIFVELLTRKPLFPGKNVVHQLDLMTDLLGTPSLEAIARVRNEKARKYLSSMRKKKLFPNADPLALRLLERMLAFKPKDRPSTEEALADPYFKGSAKVEREPSAQPVTKMEFEFERRRITKEDVQEPIYHEILEYYPKMLKEFLKGAEPTGFMYPSALDHFKKQFTYLEEHYNKGGTVIPPERQHASLPRCCFGYRSFTSSGNRKVAKGVLQKYGATVTYVEGGRAALQMLKPLHNFDAGFMDLQMPEMDGFFLAFECNESSIVAPIRTELKEQPMPQKFSKQSTDAQSQHAPRSDTEYEIPQEDSAGYSLTAKHALLDGEENLKKVDSFSRTKGNAIL
ncbi:hypothetical protein Ahy_B06g083668 [Arachis hypogaea]|uniref:Protein kinase domain-containing protein n=1 Tax=Arachis hypogaea TaxID=3818 RepID=A0A444YQB4_ARAHY|nr:hypothetical protein Ahy_B06g083668 [Arachis hypogaea]